MSTVQDRATTEMTAKKLKALAEKYGVKIVGDGRRGDVKKQWVDLINDAIIAKNGSLPDNVIPFQAEPQYFELESLKLQGYVSFQGYAIHESDYSRYNYPTNYKFQKPVYRFITGKGYKELTRGLNLVVLALKKNAEADLKY